MQLYHETITKNRDNGAASCHSPPMTCGLSPFQILSEEENCDIILSGKESPAGLSRLLMSFNSKLPAVDSTKQKKNS